MEYKDNTYLPHSCFYRFGIYSFYGRSGKGGILVPVGGRHYWRVDNVSVGVFFFRTDTEEEAMLYLL